MKKQLIATLLTTAASFSAPAMAETPGSPAANYCTMSLSNTAYEVWPGVLAQKVGRLVNTAAKMQILTSNINETYALCSASGWSLNNGEQPAGHSFRAAPSPFYGGVPVYRMRHKTKGQYFFTSNATEYNNLLNFQSAIWQPEGIAFFVPQTPLVTDYPSVCFPLLPNDLRKPGCKGSPIAVTGLAPVYRFYSATKGHTYTANYQEASEIARNQATYGYTFEGIGFWAFAPNALVQPVVLPTWQ